MVRSGSMLVASSYQRALFGPQFRVTNEYLRHCPRCLWMTSLFSEEMAPFTSHLHPFSIQTLLERGERYDKRQGQWFGPGTIANVYKDLFLEFCPASSIMHVHMCEQGLNTIFMPEILDLLTHNERAQPQIESEPVPNIPDCENPSCPCHSYPSTNQPPILILFPTLLGLRTIPVMYQMFLTRLFTLQWFVGIAGGHPTSAHFFFASQGDNVFYLDPHTVQPAENITFDPETYQQHAPDDNQQNKRPNNPNDPSATPEYLTPVGDSLNPYTIVGPLTMSRSSIEDIWTQIEAILRQNGDNDEILSPMLTFSEQRKEEFLSLGNEVPDGSDDDIIDFDESER
ncbi:Cysteine protease ATG4C [Blattamonas nauphoetae]|uniref:Cysteine protease n=1 Tax=Blattamonas nauphoetae TaxID=2049346 RepID=A0ABQ9YGX3_9EUKA|nr:Cysteine protease ATG4C [Blattamonas nauphoetae]